MKNKRASKAKPKRTPGLAPRKRVVVTIADAQNVSDPRPPEQRASDATMGYALDRAQYVARQAETARILAIRKRLDRIERDLKRQPMPSPPNAVIANRPAEVVVVPVAPPAIERPFWRRWFA